MGRWVGGAGELAISVPWGSSVADAVRCAPTVGVRTTSAAAAHLLEQQLRVQPPSQQHPKSSLPRSITQTSTSHTLCPSPAACLAPLKASELRRALSRHHTAYSIHTRPSERGSNPMSSTPQGHVCFGFVTPSRPTGPRRTVRIRTWWWRWGTRFFSRHGFCRRIRSPKDTDWSSTS